MPAQAKTEPLSEKEKAYVEQRLAEARGFVTAFSSSDADRPLTLEVLDRAWAAWLASNPQDPDQINKTINIVGAVFGDALCREAGFAWVIASDQYGTDLAVLALPGKGDALVYPANFVAKRWEQRTTDFLTSSFKAIADGTKAIAAKQGKRRFFGLFGG